MQKNWLSIYLFFLCLAPVANADTSSVVFRDVAKVMQQYDFDSGLSQVSINAIAEDQYGYLWLGTQSGLNRFDGKHFKQFYPSKGGLAGGFITSLCTQKNMLWIGTQTGLSVYSMSDGRFTSLLARDHSSILSDRIKRIQCSNDYVLVETGDTGGYLVMQKRFCR